MPAFPEEQGANRARQGLVELREHRRMHAGLLEVAQRRGPGGPLRLQLRADHSRCGFRSVRADRGVDAGLGGLPDPLREVIQRIDLRAEDQAARRRCCRQRQQRIAQGLVLERGFEVLDLEGLAGSGRNQTRRRRAVAQVHDVRRARLQALETRTRRSQDQPALAVAPLDSRRRVEQAQVSPAEPQDVDGDGVDDEYQQGQATEDPQRRPACPRPAGQGQLGWIVESVVCDQRPCECRSGLAEPRQWPSDELGEAPRERYADRSKRLAAVVGVRVRSGRRGRLLARILAAPGCGHRVRAAAVEVSLLARLRGRAGRRRKVGGIDQGPHEFAIVLRAGTDSAGRTAARGDLPCPGARRARAADVGVRLVEFPRRPLDVPPPLQCRDALVARRVEAQRIVERQDGRRCDQCEEHRQQEPAEGDLVQGRRDIGVADLPPQLGPEPQRRPAEDGHESRDEQDPDRKRSGREPRPDRDEHEHSGDADDDADDVPAGVLRVRPQPVVRLATPEKSRQQRPDHGREDGGECECRRGAERAGGQLSRRLGVVVGDQRHLQRRHVGRNGADVPPPVGVVAGDGGLAVPGHGRQDRAATHLLEESLAEVRALGVSERHGPVPADQHELVRGGHHGVSE